MIFGLENASAKLHKILHDRKILHFNPISRKMHQMLALSKLKEICDIMSLLVVSIENRLERLICTIFVELFVV